MPSLPPDLAVPPSRQVPSSCPSPAPSCALYPSLHPQHLQWTMAIRGDKHNRHCFSQRRRIEIYSSHWSLTITVFYWAVIIKGLALAGECFPWLDLVPGRNSLDPCFLSPWLYLWLVLSFLMSPRATSEFGDISFLRPRNTQDISWLQECQLLFSLLPTSTVLGPLGLH